MNYQHDFGSRRVRGRVRTASRFPHAGKSLAKRRRWYADDDDTDTKDDPEPGAEDDKGGSGDDADEEDDIPELLKQLRDGTLKPEDTYALISGLRSEAAGGRQAKKDLKALQDAQAVAKQKVAEEQGEFKKLWDEAQPKLARLAELEAQYETRREKVKEQNEARLKGLSKENRAVVDGVIKTAGTEDPDKISEILDTLLPTFGSPKPPDLNGGVKGDGKKQAASAKVKLNKAGF